MSAGTSTTGPFINACKGVLLAGLVAHMLVMDVLPAFRAVTQDFPAYITSAKIARDGLAAKLYDGPWYREQMQRYGVDIPAGIPPQNIVFAPYPPPTALLLLPLASFTPLTALRFLTVLSASV